MAIKGTGLAKREESVLLIKLNGVLYPIGKNTPDMSRSLNNTVDQNQDVLGNTNTTIAQGNQVTAVTPFKFEKDSEIAKELYRIYKEGRTLDELRYQFIEVFLFDEVSEGVCSAFMQNAKINLQSWGGNYDSLYAPFELYWEGERVHGKFDVKTRVFTPDDSIETLTIGSVAGEDFGDTIITVSPSIGTGNHYRYKTGESAEEVVANQDVSLWNVLATGVDIAPTGAVITVAEVDASAKVIKFGSTAVVYNE